MLFNYPSIYREDIYIRIDKCYDCDWFFEDQKSIVKTFDATKLERVSYLPVKHFGPFYWIVGMLDLLKGDYDTYILMGATRNFSLFIFLLIKRLFYKNKKTFLWTHGYYGKERELEWLLWKKPLLKLADGLLTYGDYAKKIMVADGFDANSIYPIHNSLAYAEQLILRKRLIPSSIYTSHFGNDNPVIVFIGRLTPVKRLDMLLESVALLKQKGEIYNVVFIGDGEMRNELEECTGRLRLRDQVWFYGACFDEKTNAELIYNAALCVAPGDIGLTAIHVLMFGCPAISHNDFRWQMPEFEVIHPNETGNFFERGNVCSLAETISKWFTLHKDDREIVRVECYEVIDNQWNPDFQMEVLKKIL